VFKLKINGTQYRLASDYEINEQAGATATMEVNVLLEGKSVPQPFDTVEVTGDAIEIEDNASGGLHTRTVGDSRIELAINEEIEDTWLMLEGMAWEDIA
jgi:hypothetical protein